VTSTTGAESRPNASTLKAARIGEYVTSPTACDTGLVVSVATLRYSTPRSSTRFSRRSQRTSRLPASVVPAMPPAGDCVPRSVRTMSMSLPSTAAAARSRAGRAPGA
jgi:hypothetical protein